MRRPAPCSCAGNSRRTFSRVKPMALKAAESIEIGHELAPRVKPIAQRQIDCYSGVRPKSIHTDAEWAKKKGFAAPLAQGLMSTAYVSQMMVDFLGEGFVRGGKISA